jgi:hypothetical protein
MAPNLSTILNFNTTIDEKFKSHNDVNTFRGVLNGNKALSSSTI